MGFLQRHFPTFSRWFGGIFGRVQARLEAAYQQWGFRRWLQTAYQDARFEIDFAAVRETCRKHLDLVENTPIIKKIRDLKIQFAVGVGGLKVIPNAGDRDSDPDEAEEWNENYSDNWEEWCKAPELGSDLTFAECTVQWEGMLFDVGNVLIHKTVGEPTPQFPRGEPKIQTIDLLRLQTPPHLASEEGKTIIQGKKLTKITRKVRVNGKVQNKEIVTGKVASYFIRDEFDTATYIEIPANEIIHKFRAMRPGMMVGLPEAFSVINKVIDYTDLHMLEMAASKIAGRIANVHKTPSGEFDTLTSRRQGMKLQTTQAGATAATVKNYGEFYDVTLGSEEFSIPVGSSIENFMVNRPTVAQQDYWNDIRTEICAGYNVPKLLVFPYSLQGTVTRADLDVCTSAFRSDFEIIASIVREIYEWRTAWAIKYDPRLEGDPPPNPLRCIIRPPRGPNVDIGYTAQRIELEMQLGITTIQDVYADKNEDWRTQLRQIAESAKFINGLAKEFGVEPSQISSLMAQQAAKSQPDKPDGNLKAPAPEPAPA